MSNIFRVNNEDTRMTSGASFVNFEHIAIYSVIIVEFQQIDVAWSCDILVSDNKFVRNIQSCGLEKFFRLHVFIFTQST